MWILGQKNCQKWTKSPISQFAILLVSVTTVCIVALHKSLLSYYCKKSFYSYQLWFRGGKPVTKYTRSWKCDHSGYEKYFYEVENTIFVVPRPTFSPRGPWHLPGPKCTEKELLNVVHWLENSEALVTLWHNDWVCLKLFNLFTPVLVEAWTNAWDQKTSELNTIFDHGILLCKLLHYGIRENSHKLLQDNLFHKPVHSIGNRRKRQ